MATQFSFGPAGAWGGGQMLPVLVAGANTSETIAESGSSQSTTATAPSGSHVVCRVVSSVAVYVSFGTAPNAGTDGSKIYMPANAIEYFTVQSGWKGAVITA